MSVGDRILQRLTALGISQSELARRVGLTQPTINALIKGGSRSSAHLHKIARELETTPAWLNLETDDLAADGPAVELTSSEREIIDLVRALAPKDRAAVEQLLRTIATSAAAPGLNDKRQDFRGE